MSALPLFSISTSTAQADSSALYSTEAKLKLTAGRTEGGGGSFQYTVVNSNAVLPSSSVISTVAVELLS